MATSYDKFTWRETEPGVWQRDIDEVEQFYSTLIKLYEGSGRMHFAITGHISLTVMVPENESVETTEQRFEEALRTAWLRLRHDNPTIGSRVHYDTQIGKWKKTYETFRDDAAQAAWLERTFQTVSSGQTGEEWANSDPPAPKLASLFVIRPPTVPGRKQNVVRRDLVLRSPHDIIDGIGTLHLLNNFVTHASKALTEDPPHHLPTFAGSETANLSPPYRIAAAVPPVPTPAQQRRLAEMTDIKEEPAGEGIEDIGIPYKSGTLLPGKHQRVARTMSANQTARLIAALKAANATVTHAFHTAIAMSMRDVQRRAATPRRVRYVNYILKNERDQCIAPFNTPKHAASVYHSLPSRKLVVDMPLPASGQTSDRGLATQERMEEFKEILNTMKNFYHSVRDDPDHYMLAPYIWSASTPQLTRSKNPSEPLPVPPPNLLPSVSISSMGLVDKVVSPECGPIGIYNPWVTGEELGNGLGLFLGTFRGQLCLSAAYNDAWHDKDEVLDFLERCEAIVFGWSGS